LEKLNFKRISWFKITKVKKKNLKMKFKRNKITPQNKLKINKSNLNNEIKK